ncbi:hypothetical protein RND71_030320 [Anisodus tanguticus]|uniref:NADP-dependent oxidoreductase domain-containing protein n=1 Tax=Anisodus tanguticus TaxID=243964 RepID=A0AAE1V0Z2_9SOLA|nr:hypothetical protein RND71_030320 [Anisodus tanguticus]
MALSFPASKSITYIRCSNSTSDPVPSPSLLKSLKIPRFWPWQKVKMGPLTVSPMGFGTWAWGNQLLWGYQDSMDSELQRTFNLAVENGINLFDTADSYGTGRLNGQSEKLLGKFIREFPGDKQVKNAIQIATKFAAYPWRLTSGQFVNACKYCSSSFLLNLLIIRISKERALWDGLVAMCEKGLVRAVGMSNYGPKQLLKIHKYLDDRGVPLHSAQVPSLLSYFTMKGLLYRQIPPGLEPLLASLRQIAQRRRKTIPQFGICNKAKHYAGVILHLGSLYFLGFKLAVSRNAGSYQHICKGTIPIPGVKSVKQAEANLGALGWQLTSDELLQ